MKEENIITDPLQHIETSLSRTLRPVTPPRDAIQRLRERIRLPESDVIISRVADWEFLIFSLAGVLAGTVLIAALARALFHIFRRRD